MAAALKPLTTVIVEDEYPARTYLSRLVGERPELQVRAACGTGLEALIELKRVPCELLLLDLNLPGLSGEELLDRLDYEVPVIVVSSNLWSPAGYLWRAVGRPYIVAHLHKPFSGERFHEVVDRLLSKG